MKYWLCLNFEPVDTLLAHARKADELGFEGVVMPDHIVVKDGPRTPHPSDFRCARITTSSTRWSHIQPWLR